MSLPPLQPSAVWRHFDRLCATPRASGAEGAIREAIRAWAAGLGIEQQVDTAGNLLLRKPASRGREHLPGVILQGHLDMVCQKNGASAHDFRRDPIRPRLADGWLIADETTLGADNGIGVALALAALECRDLAHPPLEVLLTVDEESGMSGARGLAAGLLRGRYLINLDTEDWGQFYLGCAGGLDLVASREFTTEPAPVGSCGRRLRVGGLLGGHSGVDIHLERGNAIQLLARALDALAPLGVRIERLSGGNARNALPREAEANLWLPAEQAGTLAAKVIELESLFHDQFAAARERPEMRLETLPAAQARVLASVDQQALLRALLALPHGVLRTSRNLPGVVETSDNLGVASLEAGRFEAVLMVRSLLDSGCDELARKIEAVFELIGACTARRGAYPGWAPVPDSPLRDLCHRVFRRRFGHEAVDQVIHAGLECGLLGARYPQLEMISFGPDIRGAHAPGERVEVASVGRAWDFLVDLLAALPPAAPTPAAADAAADG